MSRTFINDLYTGDIESKGIDIIDIQPYGKLQKLLQKCICQCNIF